MNNLKKINTSSIAQNKTSIAQFSRALMTCIAIQVVLFLYSPEILNIAMAFSTLTFMAILSKFKCQDEASIELTTSRH